MSDVLRFLPPVPSVDGLHPLVVHFPIALLFVAPLFVLLGALSRRSGKGLLVSGLLLMVLGTAAVWVAVPTGEAAARLAARTPEISKVLEQHEGLAETTRTVFTVLTLLFAALLGLPKLLRKEPGRLPGLAIHGLFLLIYLGGILLLASTAHLGARLVHDLGVHALLGA